MAVLLLDPRFPDVMPFSVAKMEGTKVAYTAEVPISVRWALCDTFPTARDEEAELLITTDLSVEQVRKWLAAGHELFQVPTAKFKYPEVTDAVEVMAQARKRGEWEAGQTHTSLLPYLKEETEEFIEAVESGASDEEIKKELSDIFLQVLSMLRSPVSVALSTSGTWPTRSPKRCTPVHPIFSTVQPVA